VCTLNAARVLTATAAMLGTDLAGLDDLALGAAPGAGGLTLLPYLDGERTPNLPDASGTLTGLRRASMTPRNLARAAVEGMLCGLADGLDALRAVGVEPRRVLLVGGAAASAAVRRVAPDVFGVPVLVPASGEYVARGAARQAAWALSGAQAPPSWQLPLGDPADGSGVISERSDPAAGAAVRTAYATARVRVHGI
jgi:xylulokinase